ncbi:MAG: FAD-dependent oxidoreductase [Clostridiales bacterium]|mgnify:CR=1 FL=1|nr:FAD-dependent oxidoreductase [Clostridiales bacterium]
MQKDYDIIVSGGGLTGVAAAISAKRSGVKDVLLIERYGFLGGMATSGLVHPFMSYFRARKPYKEENQLIFGIFQEILDSLKALNGLERASYFDAEAMKLVLNNMILENDVSILLHTYVADVKKEEDNYIDSIKVVNKSGIADLKAKMFIDCTGDADIAHMAGVPCKKGSEDSIHGQPMTMCFRVANVDRENMPSRNEINRLYTEAVKRGEVNNPRENVLMFDTLQDDVVHFNTTRIIKRDATDAKELTEAELEVRSQCWQMFHFLKKHIKGFENSYFQVSAPQIGIRESRRIVGRYILTEEDVLTGEKFDDSICYNAYDVDIHNPSGTGTVIKSLDEGDYYGIPYRCLLPLEIDNLLVAGRPISSTHEAHSSLRVMPSCTAMGQAAGTAAALVLENDILPHELDTSILLDRLIEDGAFPNDIIK